MPHRARRVALATALALALTPLLAACAGDSSGSSAGSGGAGGSGSSTSSSATTAADRPEPPALGACRVLSPKDVEKSSDDTSPVPCSKGHTAETFAIGTLPASTGNGYDDQRHGRWIYRRCGRAFGTFLGADESEVLRSRVSWAWFRPSEEGWAAGARWYRCDVLGGPEQAERYDALPTTAEGLFNGRPPQPWLTCATGPTMTGSVKVECSRRHDWRAVTTIKLGGPRDAYPGDRRVQVRSRDFCSDSVGAYLSYPPEYDFGFTWFREAEWKAGNRRTVCWAKTDQ